MSAEHFEIRPPMALRVYVGIFAGVWLGGVTIAFVGILLSDSPAAALVPAFMLVVGGFVLSANLRMRVVVEPGGLRVRNFWREEYYPRSEIDRILEHTMAPFPVALGGQIAVLLRSGKLVDLRVTMTGPFGRRRRNDQLARLQQWLALGSGWTSSP